MIALFDLTPLEVFYIFCMSFGILVVFYGMIRIVVSKVF